MYYRAIVTLATESVDDQGFCLDDYNDLGEINRYTAATLPELFDKIERQFTLENFDAFENWLEASVEVNDHHGHRLERYSIYVTTVIEDDLAEGALEAARSAYVRGAK